MNAKKLWNYIMGDPILKFLFILIAVVSVLSIPIWVTIAPCLIV